MQRRNADQADQKTKRAFFYMMQDLGIQLNTTTGVFTVLETAEDAGCQFLDLCMAPGGFSKYLLDSYPRAKAFGISLPLASGGHQLLLNLRDPRVTVKFLDITLLYSEMMSTPTIDAIQIPSGHPDRNGFLYWRPYLHERFDLILCDGQVLRTHERHQYRETAEPTRLLMSQLILGLKRIRPGGNMIVLLHKLEHWNPLALLNTFHKFSEVQLFKSGKQHAKRSSFYMIAKNVQPASQEARDAIVRWTKFWLAATFEGEVQPNSGTTGAAVNMLLAQFGSQYIELGVPIWKTQKEALERWGYCKDTRNENGDQQLEGRSPV